MTFLDLVLSSSTFHSPKQPESTFPIMKSLVTLFGVLTAFTVAAPVVVESLDQAPPGWEEVGSPAPDKLVKLSIGLRSEDHLLLERTLDEVSDPSHPNYGKHLSREAAKALLKPPSEANESVRRWLADAGVPAHRLRDDGQWIHAYVPFSQAESLLTTHFGVFARDDEHVVRTRQYSVPAEVRDHITTIQPTTFFGSPDTNAPRDLAPSDFLRLAQRTDPEAKRNCASKASDKAGVDLNKCKTVLTPACIRKLYGMSESHVDAHPKSLYGIVGFNGVSRGLFVFSLGHQH